jgi:hypothetical protein
VTFYVADMSPSLLRLPFWYVQTIENVKVAQHSNLAKCKDRLVTVIDDRGWRGPCLESNGCETAADKIDYYLT